MMDIINCVACWLYILPETRKVGEPYFDPEAASCSSIPLFELEQIFQMVECGLNSCNTSQRDAMKKLNR